jgi:hypothetical protein
MSCASLTAGFAQRDREHSVAEGESAPAGFDADDIVAVGKDRFDGLLDFIGGVTFDHRPASWHGHDNISTRGCVAESSGVGGCASGRNLTHRRPQFDGPNAVEPQ